MFTEAFLFDLDGTLTDSDPLHFAAFAETARGYGVDMDEEMFVKKVSGQTNANICKTLFTHIELEEHARIADEKEELFRQMIVGKLKPIPGVVDLMKWAKARGCGFALVSNAPRANITDMLAELGIAGLFDIIVCASELPRGKPDPLPYLTGLELLGVKANRAVAFEDAAPGLTAAHRAGIATVGLTTSLSPEALLGFGADIAVQDYTDPKLRAFVETALSGNFSR